MFYFYAPYENCPVFIDEFYPVLALQIHRFGQLFVFSIKVPETSYKDELYRTYNNMITESQVQAKERERLCTEHNKLEKENQQQFELM